MSEAPERQSTVPSAPIVDQVLRETLAGICEDPRFDTDVIEKLRVLADQGRFTASRIKEALRPPAGERRETS